MIGESIRPPRGSGWGTRAAALAAAILVLDAGAADVVVNRTEDLEYACAQPTPGALECRYRPLFSGELRGVGARLEQMDLEAARTSVYPAPDNTTAIIFLVDSTSAGSDHRLEHLRTMLAKAESHHRLGLAVFDDAPRFSLGPGASADEIAAATRHLEDPHVVQPRYRDLVEAVRTLAGYTATRKAIYFFTEGRGAAEVYYHPDLVRAALEAAVIIYPFVYTPPGTVGPGVEALARLGAESGGAMIRLDPFERSLPQGYAAQPFAAIDAGGQFSLDLAPAIEAGIAGARWVTLDVQFDAKRLEVPVPVTIAEAARRDRRAGPRVAASNLDQGLSGDLMLYLATAAFVSVLTAGLVYFSRSRRQRPLPEPDTLTIPRAYLIRKGQGGSRIRVSTSPWHVGRGEDNELVLADSSVSRHHAEITRRGEGGFVVRDLDSLNGLFVNDKKVREASIRDGTQIDFGDVRFTFQVEDPAERTRDAPD